MDAKQIIHGIPSSKIREPLHAGDAGLSVPAALLAKCG